MAFDSIPSQPVTALLTKSNTYDDAYMAAGMVYDVSASNSFKSKNSTNFYYFERQFQLSGLWILIRTDRKVKWPRCTVLSTLTVSWYSDWEITMLTNTKCTSLTSSAAYEY